MSQWVISTTHTGDAPRLQVSVHVQAEVMSAQTARRRANVWLPIEHRFPLPSFVIR